MHTSKRSEDSFASAHLVPEVLEIPIEIGPNSLAYRASGH